MIRRPPRSAPTDTLSPCTTRFRSALLVSEPTLLPVLMPLAPAATLARRFPAQLELVLKEHNVPSDFIAQEVWRLDKVQYAKTANRSDVGILKIGRAHVCTPVTNAHLVCRLLLEKKKDIEQKGHNTDPKTII